MFYGIIYLLTNTVNGKQYIGQTIHSIEKRFRQHCRSRRKNKAYLKKALDKYGPDAFEKSVLFVAFSLQGLNEAEESLMTEYQTLAPSGYNLRSGGGQPSMHPDTRARLSAIRTGTRTSDKQKELLSLSLLAAGVRPSSTTRAKMSIASRGVAKSPEHRAAISAAMRNRISRR